MTLLIFIVILSLLVFVHELGHFLVAKKMKMYVEEFGFGLPPRIWGKKIGETIYSINALPIGGFVKLYGESGQEAEKGSSLYGSLAVKGKAYFDKPIWQRLAVLLAGVTMNLFLAIISFTVIYFVLGVPTKLGRVKIEGIVQGSPAQAAQLKIDDVIVAVDSRKIKTTDEFIAITKKLSGQKMILEISRKNDNPCKTGSDKNVLGGMAVGQFGFSCNGENLLISVIPRKNPPVDEGPLGIAISDTELKKYPFYLMPIYGAVEGLRESVSWGKQILSSLKSMIVTLVFKGQFPKDIAGPIGIFQVTGQVAKAGNLALLQFLGILSVNLAIMNVLPFPALDGGRIVFLAYEVVTRKKASAKVEMIVNNIGMAILLGLMVLITVNDIIRLVSR